MTEHKATALLSAYEHVRRTGEAIRKAGRIFGVPESTLRTRLNNPNLFKSRQGHPRIFSMAEEAQLADPLWLDLAMDTVGGRCLIRQQIWPKKLVLTKSLKRTGIMVLSKDSLTYQYKSLKNVKCQE